ncbi:MAG: HNH endonuclease [Chthonomonadaceae bacterium]|nr:HNH endonuclease [Chthonomonadaceae bacterium]
MNFFYPAVAERAEFRCEYCRTPEHIFNFTFEVDHIHPRAKGGETTLSNLALSCESCNLFKSDMTHVYDDVEKQNIALFHPRRDPWRTHFLCEIESGEIVGRTATGRITLKQTGCASFRRIFLSIKNYPVTV